MKKKLPSFSIEQMYQYRSQVLIVSKNRSKEDLDKDLLFYHGVLRMLTLIGEAANRVDRNTQKNYPGIPWKQIVGLRNILVHQYDSIDISIVWEILVEFLPATIKNIKSAHLNQIEIEKNIK